MLTISIVLYQNEKEQIIEAVKSGLKTDREMKLLLVDNSPTDELKYLAEIDKERIEYIFNDANIGFGAGHNIAIKKVQDYSTYHLVLNPDVSFEHGVLDSLIDFMDENPDVGNVMPKVYYEIGELQYLCKLLPTPYDWIGRRFNPFKSLVEKRNNLFEMRFTGYKEQMQVPYLSGCFMFLRISALKKIGLFDERIFMYGEETDLGRRLIAGGYKTIFYPKVSIIHLFQKGSHKSRRLTWIGIQSAWYYFNKWGWFFDRERRQINKNTLRQFKETVN